MAPRPPGSATDDDDDDDTVRPSLTADFWDSQSVFDHPVAIFMYFTPLICFTNSSRHRLPEPHDASVRENLE